MASPLANWDSEEAGVRWLIRLRWVATAGVLGVVCVAGPVLRLISHPRELLGLGASLGVFNLIVVLRRRQERRVPGALLQVMVDMTVLVALLFFSGGLRNPFAVFLVVQLMVAAILLPMRPTLLVFGYSLVLIAALSGLETAGALPDSHALRESLFGVAGVSGVAVALAMTAGIAITFTRTLMKDLRGRSAEVVRYHEQSERERERFFDVLQSMDAAIVLVDEHRIVVWANQGAKEALPVTRVGSRLDLVGLEDWPPSLGAEGLATAEREWTTKRTDGRTRTYQVRASPGRPSAGTREPRILIFTDVTERRSSLEELYRTDKLAALGRLAAGVAHEINTPIASVRLLGAEAEEALPQALEGSTEAQATVRESLSDLRKESDRIAFLVRRLLDASHPGTDRTGPCDLVTLVEEAIRLISLRAGRKPVRITSHAEVKPLQIHTSRDRLRQVLINILDNALDATRKAEAPVTVTSRVEGEHAVIEVEDQGEGIPAAVLPRVFEPFFTTKEVGEGTGLGLYVSYEIVKNLGGEITIESRLGEGTLVRISLPRTEGHP